MDNGFSSDDYVYSQLADLLRVQIAHGDLEGKIPGIRELAQQYSVNFKTANKAVSMLVEEGLLHRLQGRGTFVTEKTSQGDQVVGSIGFVITDITNPYFAQLAQSVQKVAYEQKISVFVNTDHSSTDRLEQILDTYQQRKIQLVIVHGGVVRHRSALDALVTCGIPLVGIHTHLAAIDDVWPDVRAGAQLVTEHLIERYGPNVGLVSGSDDPVRETGRFRGFRDAILRSRNTVDFRYVVETEPTFRGGYQAIVALLQQDGLPKALLFYNQIMAMGGVSALIAHGVQVPRDLAVASIDDGINAEQMLVPTTTVALPFEETARHALYLAQRRLQNPTAPVIDIRVMPRLVVHETSSIELPKGSGYGEVNPVDGVPQKLDLLTG